MKDRFRLSCSTIPHTHTHIQKSSSIEGSSTQSTPTRNKKTAAGGPCARPQAPSQSRPDSAKQPQRVWRPPALDSLVLLGLQHIHAHVVSLAVLEVLHQTVVAFSLDLGLLFAAGAFDFL